MFVQILQFFVALSILILLHEWGHFYAARLFKTRVDKFYLFFDFLFPLPNVANFSLFKKKIGDTEYGLGWFPLGGYVKIAGMVDETTDASELSAPPQPWEYRAKPRWQRLIIILGGVFVNFVLGVFIYYIILLSWGENYLPIKNIPYGIACDSVSEVYGFKDGDIPVSIAGKPMIDFMDFQKELITNYGQDLVVNRNGKTTSIPITKEFIRDIKRRPGFISIRNTFTVEEVNEKSAALAAGFKKGDRPISVNDKDAYYFSDFREQVVKNSNKKVIIRVLRNADTIQLTAVVPASGILGVKLASDSIATENKSYTVLSAIPRSFGKTVETLGFYIKNLSIVFDKKMEGYKDIGGFKAMANIFPQEADIQTFLQILAFISIMLGFMNLLPIPMLDGGYALFLVLEMIMRKDLPTKVISYLNLIGMVFLIGLMLYANGNDIFGFWK